MAWGSHAQIVLGDDLMSGRDYSDETARVIDEEVERILRTQQDRARRALVEQRPALDRIAAALLDLETITGEQITALVVGPVDTAASGNGSLESTQTPRASVPVIERAASPADDADD